MLEKLIIYALISGSIYALIALGFSLVFGVADILNLSHGVYYMAAGYLVLTLLGITNNLLLATILSVLLTTLLGLLFYFIIKPVMGSIFKTLLITFSLSLLFQELIFIKYGVSTYSIPNLIEGNFTILGVSVVKQGVFAALFSLLIIVGVYYFLEKTRTGRSIRAVSQNAEIAMLSGINVNRVKMIIIVLAAFLASIAGVLYSPLQALHPTMWMHALIVSFVIVVLGGMGSIKGTVIAAFLIAFCEFATSLTFATGSYLKTGVFLTIMIVILMLRPQGLFGKNLGSLEVQR